MSETEDTYKTIVNSGSGFFKDRGSKFTGYAYPVENEAAVKEKIEALKKEHYGARHHCYAYQLGFGQTSRYRANDDGEPNNSAGMPIYGQIRSHELTNVLIVVVRYFGGTKLGVPGLINAYRTAAAAALENTKIIIKVVTETLKIRFDYAQTGVVMGILNKQQWELSGQDFEQNSCIVLFKVRRNELSKAKKMLSTIENLTFV